MPESRINLRAQRGRPITADTINTEVNAALLETHQAIEAARQQAAHATSIVDDVRAAAASAHAAANQAIDTAAAASLSAQDATKAAAAAGVKAATALASALSSTPTAKFIPTSGQGDVGNLVRNSAPAVQGVSGSQYITIGWVCTSPGSPGTWMPMRVLTGT